MRIVSGKFKGRVISAPSGRGTRPTADRTREALFNILQHALWAPDLVGARVIDAFAGSGALGLEALSRGASFCLFVETDSAARGCLRANIEALQLFGVARIHRRSAIDLGPRPAALGAPFDLAFLDPPYGQGFVPQTLAQLEAGGWLARRAHAIAETSADEDAPRLDAWDVLDERVYGAARLTCLRSRSVEQDGVKA